MIENETEESLAEKYVKLGQELKKLQSMFAVSQSFLWKALNLYKSLEPPNNDMIHEIYGVLGTMSFEVKDWNQAFKLFKECEKHINEADFEPSSELNAYLGSVCTYLENFDEAVKYFQKILQSSKDREQIRIAYHSLATINERRGMLKEALELYQKAVEYQKHMTKNASEIEASLKKISEIESIFKRGQ